MRLIKSDTQSKKKLNVKITLQEKTCPIQSYTTVVWLLPQARPSPFSRSGMVGLCDVLVLSCLSHNSLAVVQRFNVECFSCQPQILACGLVYPSKGYPWASCWPPDHLLDSLSVKVSHAADSSQLQNLSSGMVPVPTGQGWSCRYHLSRVRVNTYPPT